VGLGWLSRLLGFELGINQSKELLFNCSTCFACVHPALGPASNGSSDVETARALEKFQCHKSVIPLADFEAHHIFKIKVCKHFFWRRLLAPQSRVGID
jgi:hypothetical protein